MRVMAVAGGMMRGWRCALSRLILIAIATICELDVHSCMSPCFLLVSVSHFRNSQ